VGTSFKAALGYKSDNFAFVANTGSVSTDTSGTVDSGMTHLHLSDMGYCDGHIRHIAYFPRRVSDTNLQLLTA
jgi:hypothetical protein